MSTSKMYSNHLQNKAKKMKKSDQDTLRWYVEKRKRETEKLKNINPNGEPVKIKVMSDERAKRIDNKYWNRQRMLENLQKRKEEYEQYKKEQAILNPKANKQDDTEQEFER